MRAGLAPALAFVALSAACAPEEPQPFVVAAPPFGFVQPADGGADLFVHSSILLAVGLYELGKGDAV
jgi:hypothetical protein